MPIVANNVPEDRVEEVIDADPSGGPHVDPDMAPEPIEVDPIDMEVDPIDVDMDIDIGPIDVDAEVTAVMETARCCAAAESSCDER